MAPSRKSVTEAVIVAPAYLKGKGKTIKAIEPADCQPNLSNIHIFDAKDFHSNTISLLQMQDAEHEPPLNSEQLLD